MKGSWVFAYGSNMHREDLSRWLEARGLSGLLPRAEEVAILRGHRLPWSYFSRSRGAGAANVAPAEGEEVWGLAQLVDEDLLFALDEKEGHPERTSRRSNGRRPSMEIGRKERRR